MTWFLTIMFGWGIASLAGGLLVGRAVVLDERLAACGAEGQVCSVNGPRTAKVNPGPWRLRNSVRPSSEKTGPQNSPPSTSDPVLAK